MLYVIVYLRIGPIANQNNENCSLQEITFKLSIKNYTSNDDDGRNYNNYCSKINVVCIVFVLCV